MRAREDVNLGPKRGQRKMLGELGRFNKLKRAAKAPRIH